MTEQAALDELQTCVDACRLGGYRLRDATLPRRGLDLRALAADHRRVARRCGPRRPGAESVPQAVRLADAWRRPGGERASGFVGRHGAAAQRLASAMQATRRLLRDAR